MPTVVIGTAGHIDHGKTSLLRALTGIDADRLPEERDRGMTIDVGFAHLDLEDGSSLDFVDVPGHDRLVGNMLVGAGEVDAALLVVAADDGPRAQTLEHLELLDAMGVDLGVVAVTKTDLVLAERVAEVEAAVVALVAGTLLAGSPVVAVSSVSGAGVDVLRERLVELRDRVLARRAAAPSGPLRLSIDRAFAVRGRGVVVTGTLRGGGVEAGTRLRVEPGGGEARVREVQVHYGPVERHDCGRVALNLAGVEAGALRRGQVLTAGPGVEASDRLLVRLQPTAQLGAVARSGARRWPPRPGTLLRLHLATDQVVATAGPTGGTWLDIGDGGIAAILRLAAPVAATMGDRGILRDPASGQAVAGVRVLDARPPHGISRRRMTVERLAVLDVASTGLAAQAALTELHGAIGLARLDAAAGALENVAGASPAQVNGSPSRALALAPDVRTQLEEAAIQAVRLHHERDAVSTGLQLGQLRTVLIRQLRRLATIARSEAAAAEGAVDAVLEGLVNAGTLARSGDRVHDPARRADASDPLGEAMTRLEALLDVPAPPSLAEAARAAGCPPEGIRALDASGRIVRVEPDLAWAAAAHARLAATAVALARRGPVPPSELREATGISRRYVMALLDDLGRRGILRRTDAGHALGPKAPGPA